MVIDIAFYTKIKTVDAFWWNRICVTRILRNIEKISLAFPCMIYMHRRKLNRVIYLWEYTSRKVTWIELSNLFHWKLHNLYRKVEIYFSVSQKMIIYVRALIYVYSLCSLFKVQGYVKFCICRLRLNSSDWHQHQRYQRLFFDY